MIYNKLLLTLVFTISISLLMGSQGAFAATVTDNLIPAPTIVIDFSEFDGVFCPPPNVDDGPYCRGMGPIQVGNLVGEDVQWTADNAFAFLGNGGYGLVSNGNWDSGRNGYAATDADDVMMTFTFAEPVCAVVGFVNYIPDFGPDFMMEIFDGGGGLLESFNVSMDAPISTPGATNDGEFRGFVRATNEIASLELSGSFDVLDDLEFSRNCVVVGGEIIPIDASALLIGGLFVNSFWMLPALAGIAGAGAYLVRTRMNKE